MNAKPKFSVCIPTYNRAHVLPKVIGSVLGQTYKDFELFVSDDASTDDTEKVVRGFKDPRIRYHRNVNNLGVLGNWNFTVSNASGECVFKLDDDDYVAPTYLEKVAAVFDRHPEVGSVYTGFYYAKDYEGGVIAEVVDRKIFKEERTRGLDYVLPYLLHTGVPGLHPSSAVFRYSLAEKIGFYNKAKNDLMFSLALASVADVGYVHEPLFYYVQHTGARATHADGKVREFDPLKIVSDFYSIDAVRNNPELMAVKERVFKRELVVRSIMHLLMTRRQYGLSDYVDVASSLVGGNKKLLLSPVFVAALTGLVLMPRKVAESGGYMYKSSSIFSRIAGIIFGRK